jgi:HlyD family secretion protein
VQTAVVRNFVAGTVARVYVGEGMRVQAGERLIGLRNVPLQSEFARAQADYEVASIKARSAVLHYGDFGAADQQRNALSTQANVLQTEASGLEVVSPISGVVLTPRLADQMGSYAPEGTTLAEVGNLSRMRARIFVSEHDLYKVAVGSPARIQVDGLWGKVNARVISIAPRSSNIDPALATENTYKGLQPPNFYVAQIEMGNPDGRLKPGMIGDARIYGERRSLVGLFWQQGWRFFARKLW